MIIIQDTSGTEGHVNYAAFPATGEENVIYIDISTGRAYYWNGSYTPLSSGGFSVNLANTEASVVRSEAGGRTIFTVTHSLNTLDIKPEVFRLSNGRTVGWRIERTGANTIEASRSGSVSNGLFRIII